MREPRRSQARAQESPGDLRRAQESADRPIRAKETPGESRKTKESPEAAGSMQQALSGVWIGSVMSVALGFDLARS